MISLSAIEWGAGSFIIALVVLAAIYLLSRPSSNRRLKIGFFLERERFKDEEDDER